MQQRQALRDETDAQQKQEEGRQDGHVRAGDHQCVERAGRAVFLGPDFLQLERSGR